jgi:hypothetical protein
MQQHAVRAHPERTAWIVVWCAFAVLVLLVVCVPLGVRRFLLFSTVTHPPELRMSEGTAVVDNPATGSQFAVTKDETRTIPMGSVINLQPWSRADVSFFDGSSLHILPGSRVAVERVEGPRFSMGVRPNAIHLRAVSGRVKIVTTAPSWAGGLGLVLRLPLFDAEVSIRGDGVYGVEIEPDGVEVFANRGSAIVTSSGKSVQLTAPERTRVEAGRPPAPPIADARELIVNGSFAEPLEPVWTVFNDQGHDGGDVGGTAVRMVHEGLPAVRFFRTGSGRNHCQTVLEQVIDRDLPDPISSLVVRANLKLIHQSLSGGGSLGSEYPLMIRLRYRDIYDSENEWVQAFYYENPHGNPVGSALEYSRDTWQLFESGNLLESLDPTPHRLLWLQVYASGWDYESMIRWVSVTVR